ncbi:hypothetical protein [Virgibacillus oceani]|uniref:Uncharacterized protein n=1 Tax=Virgibacillus oceani TaxID=1479511 RepID=A0A917H1I3_9BACI|nr:hypothetical protein [Virgibacillus oceani]GGG64523.1 hypothetical protein GCM10011398_05150 [Virgibacillus oceani]
MPTGLVFQEYGDPIATGWKGWIENAAGAVVVFVKLDGRVVKDW